MILTDSLTHSLTRRLEIDGPIPPQVLSLRLRHQPVTQMECHTKENVTQNAMSLNMEYHSKWNVTENGMSLKMKYH